MDAEKALSECKAALDQLEMLRKGYLEEKSKGETQLNGTKNKIKTVNPTKSASKRETRKDFDTLCLILPQTQPAQEFG